MVKGSWERREALRLLLQKSACRCDANGGESSRRPTRFPIKGLPMPSWLFLSPACRRQLPSHIEVGVPHNSHWLVFVSKTTRWICERKVGREQFWMYEFLRSSRRSYFLLNTFIRLPLSYTLFVHRVSLSRYEAIKLLLSSPRWLND